MKTPLFTGSGVAIVTPFNQETVDLEALRQLLDFQLQNGTDAVIVCGTTGEAATMSYAERMRTIECCVEHVNGRALPEPAPTPRRLPAPSPGTPPGPVWTVCWW